MRKKTLRSLWENISKFFGKCAGSFTGRIINRENIGKTADELVAILNATTAPTW